MHGNLQKNLLSSLHLNEPEAILIDTTIPRVWHILTSSDLAFEFEAGIKLVSLNQAIPMHQPTSGNCSDRFTCDASHERAVLIQWLSFEGYNILFIMMITPQQACM
jgi:hypothetical protein